MKADMKYCENQISIESDYTGQYQLFSKNAFSDYIREKWKEYNEEYGEEFSTRKLAKLVGINYEMFRKIVNQEKPTKKRDCIIAICFALKFTPGETDEALNKYQYMPALDESNPRDCFIQALMKKGSGIPISELNSRLIQNGFPGLDIHDTRGGRKELTNAQVFDNQFFVLSLKVITQFETHYLYNEVYGSLSTQYDPDHYQSYADMYLIDHASKHTIRLSTDSDGRLFSMMPDVDKTPIIYKTIAETGNYKQYYESMEDALSTEKHRLLQILNDTRNYNERASAMVSGDSIIAFAETFNYAIPELNEYYDLSYSHGRYELNVYHHSAFMSYYLPEKIYQKYYGKKYPEKIETYDSVDQLDILIKTPGLFSDEAIRYRMRKRAFVKLQAMIDELLCKIKKHEVYIRNPENRFENPADILRFYNLEKKYNCKYEEEYGDIFESDENADFTLDEGITVSLSIDDLLEAYYLGLNDVAEICRIKHNLGSVAAVIEN